MKRKIVGYELDFENFWIAWLECGHGQHVRHRPPWETRTWTTTEEGRRSMLGTELNCLSCDREHLGDAEPKSG